MLYADDNINKILGILIGFFAFIVATLTAYITWVVKQRKKEQNRNNVFRELLNWEGGHVDKEIKETKTLIDMWEAKNSDGTYKIKINPDIRHFILSQLHNNLDSLQERSKKYHSLDLILLEEDKKL